MKKTIIAGLLSFGLIGTATAQKKVSGGNPPAFGVGSSTIGLFAGFGVEYGYYGSPNQLPALGVLYDHGIVKAGPGTIGIGGIAAFKYASYKYASGSYRASWTNFILAARGTYHLTLLKDKNNKFDPYGGVTVGLRFSGYSDNYYSRNDLFNPNDYNSVNPIFGMFVGAKYNFTPNFGAFAEVGYDISFIKMGINFNLR